MVLAASFKEIRQWDEATTAAREAVRMKADDVDARLVLIEVCRAIGNADAAQELVQEASKLKPDFSVAKWAETQPYKDLAVLERITANLRSAGLAS
ncbi:MAG: tetratricopeptide repeat protein [Burkholderiales bacterium]